MRKMTEFSYLLGRIRLNCEKAVDESEGRDRIWTELSISKVREYLDSKGPNASEAVKCDGPISLSTPRQSCEIMSALISFMPCNHSIQ